MEPISYKHVWAAIIAGGQGTRLFPLSHDKCPKQFCQLDEKNTFIQATAKRFISIGVKASRIVVITTNSNQTMLANEQLTPLGVLSQNILEINPKYDYAGAMIKAGQFINHYDEQAVIINTPADQYIVADDSFEDAMKLAITSAQNGSPTIIGVKIHDLCTFMGCGHAMYNPEDGAFCREVTGFVEKPDRELADRLMREGNTACNTGINVWSAADLLAATDHIDLETTKVGTSELMQMFSRLSLAVGEFKWFDCGTLKSFYDISKKTPNHRNASFGDVSRFKCRNSLFMAPEGVEIDANYVEGAAVIVNIIDGVPVLAIVKLEDSQRVRQLAEDYQKNKDFLTDDFSVGARNNRVIATNFSEEVRLGFVGVRDYDVVPMKLRDDRIKFVVSYDGTRR